MGDLAECVGLRKASLFHHFESKDVLYATVLSQLLDEMRIAISGAVASEGSFIDRLDALTDALTGMLGAQPHSARLLIREVMDWGPLMRERLSGSIQTVLDASVEFAKAGQREGIFHPNLDPHHIVVSLIGIYFMPFVLDRMLVGFLGKSPFEPPFIEERRCAVREQIRNLALVTLPA